MRVLLVEPAFRHGSRQAIARFRNGKKAKDAALWYPPVGLLKLARFHRQRGDKVRFVIGCDGKLVKQSWDRVYVTTVFTFHHAEAVKTIRYYRKYTDAKILVGGIAANLMADEIKKETGIEPVPGVIRSPKQLGLPGKQDIEALSLDYHVVRHYPYAVKDTFYAYTSRGCVRHCPWCAVSKIEPRFEPYIDIKTAIGAMRRRYGDKPFLKLMDNNVLASPDLHRIVLDLLDLGYAKDSSRVVDYNQGLDADYVSEETMDLVRQINISPFRIAFDRIAERQTYVQAIKLAVKNGFRTISNYLLYNFKNDTPMDLYRRLRINIKLNELIGVGTARRRAGIFSYPMRYAPIEKEANQHRDWRAYTECCDWFNHPVWTPRFVRSVEVMRAATHGVISPTPGLARRVVGDTFAEFLCNLYMPEELLRYRNKHEKKIYPWEKRRPPGTGQVEAFRRFIDSLPSRNDDRFRFFHGAVAPNTTAALRAGISGAGRDTELRNWLQLYLLKV